MCWAWRKPPGLKGMKKRLGGDHKAEIKTRSDEAAALFEQMTQLICCSEAEAETDRQITLPRLRALFAAVRDFDARFTARKRERKLLEFSDFEHLALRLLRTPEGTPTPLCGEHPAGLRRRDGGRISGYERPAGRPLPLPCRPGGGQPLPCGRPEAEHLPLPAGRAGHLPAKAGQLAAAAGRKSPSPPAGGHPGTDALLALDANFRSAPQVVAGINYLFEQLMTPELGDTAYGDGQRLVCGAPGEYQGSVEVQFLPDDETGD